MPQLNTFVIILTAAPSTVAKSTTPAAKLLKTVVTVNCLSTAPDIQLPMNFTVPARTLTTLRLKINGNFSRDIFSLLSRVSTGNRTGFAPRSTF